MYERLRECRKDMDLTQAKLAKFLHIAQTTYSDYEQGKVKIPPEILTKLAMKYHTSVDYLLDVTDEPKPYPRKQNK